MTYTMYTPAATAMLAVHAMVPSVRSKAPLDFVAPIALITLSTWALLHTPAILATTGIFLAAAILAVRPLWPAAAVYAAIIAAAVLLRPPLYLAPAVAAAAIIAKLVLVDGVLGGARVTLRP